MPDHVQAILNATDSSIPSVAALSPLARLLLQQFVRELDPQSPSDPVPVSETRLTAWVQGALGLAPVVGEKLGGSL